MYLFAVIVIVIFAIFAMIIGAQNFNTYVTLHLLGKDIQNISVTLIAMVSLAVGIILAFILAIVDGIRLRRRLARQNKEIIALRKELGALKMPPEEIVPTQESYEEE
ncbi:MAG TPA: LapA family protein [bacterium (Candidatus Stahlbacteria)]|nr:LapA family protein [Candidatus Stahlbacteria bacterium]